jgi:L-glutamine---4-(methylsulfanyl)-2-oxobutanoate aminotransferase
MAGWRIGFAVGNATLIARIKSLVDHMTAGVWVGLQRGLTAALTSDQADVAARRAVYAARRDLMVRTLTQAGIPPAPAEGSFFIWWPLPPGVTPESLIADQRVGVAPGQGFGATGQGYARLSLALADEDVALAAQRLATTST